jgi:hypothetical protein
VSYRLLTIFRFLFLLFVMSAVVVAAADLPNVVINDVADVGLGAAGDNQLAASLRLPVLDPALAESHKSAIMRFVASVEWPAGLDVEVRDTLDLCGALCIVHKGYADERKGDLRVDGDVTVVNTAPPGTLTSDQSARYMSIIRGLADSGVSGRAWLIVIATKVNLWQQNHHVGQGGASGFAAKVAEFTWGTRADDNAIAGMHRVGHWFSTRGVLGSLELKSPDIHMGIKDEAKGDIAMDGIPRPTRDIVLRLNSPPSGSARAGFVITVLRIVAKTPYAACLTGIDGVADLVALRDEMAKCPVAYHVGATYLSDGAESYRGIEAVTDTLLAMASIYTTKVMSGSTLSRAKVAMNAADAEAICPDVAQNIGLMRMQLVGRKIERTEIAAIAASYGGVTNANPLATLVEAGRAFDVEGALASAPAAAAAAPAGSS